MDGSPVIDTSFDFRIDSAGKDPDKYSPTLRRYHRMLWSKPLPGGEVFALEDGGGYLQHTSHLGQFFLSSDSVTPTFTQWRRMRHLVEQFPAGSPNPLGQALARYADFFALFDDFEGYVDFFLLNDLVDNGDSVRFFLPFDGFAGRAAPTDIAGYRQFRAATIDFLRARNQRIEAWSRQHLR